MSPRVKRVIARAQPYLPQCKASLIEALPAMKEAGIHGITLEGMKFKKRKPGLVKVGGDWAYPEGELERDYLAIRSRCRELGLAFFCAENRLRRLGDSTACCGCGDLPGFEGNRFNCVSIANGSGVGPSETMREPGTADCFKSVHQKAGMSRVLRRKSFAELMTDSAGAV